MDRRTRLLVRLARFVEWFAWLLVRQQGLMERLTRFLVRRIYHLGRVPWLMVR
jgi:hypothetical protein